MLPQYRRTTDPLAVPSGTALTLTPLPSVDALEFDDVCISCVIPCLNECDNLHLILPLLRTQLSALSSKWEIIVIDDGSTDGTTDLMTEWSMHDGMQYVQFSRNFGKEAALSAGMETASGDIVICLDADLQHPPALIKTMLMRWRQGADMVYAVRSNRDDESWVKRLGTSCFYGILGRSEAVDIPTHAGDFRLMDRCVVDALIALPERTRFMKGLYAWVGFHAEPVSYIPEDRAHGTSHYGIARLIKLALAGITAFTTWPLRILSPGSVATPRATRDARLARRFATVFGRLVRGSLPKSCLIDPLQTSPGGHPAKTGTA